VLQTLIGELQMAGQPELAAAYLGALRAVSAIVEAETYDKWSQGSHRQFVALNVPGCMHLLRLVDRALDGFGTCSVQHDSTPEFETLLSHYVEPITGAGAEDCRLRDGTIFRAGFRNIEDFQIASSASSPPLQAADLLASAVARIARASIMPDKPELEKLRGVAKLTLPALMYEDNDPSPQFAGAYMHDRTLAGLLMHALFGGAAA
jgi:hypothetical protein